MEAGDFGVVGVGPVGSRDDAEGWHGGSVLGPLNVLCELVTIRIGTCDLNVNAVTRSRCGDGSIGSHRHRNPVEHRDGDAVRDVESCSADTVGLNGPLTNRRGFPTHVVEQQVGGDVRDFTRSLVHLNPRQGARINSVVVSVVEVRKEIHGIVRGHLKHSAGCCIRVVCRSSDADRVEETVVNGHVDGDLMKRCAVIVAGGQHVGFVACKVRRKGRGIAHKLLEEGRRIAHGRMRNRPVGINRPLIALAVDSEDFGLQCFIGCEVKVLPCRNDIVHFNSQRLNHTPRNDDVDRGKCGFIPCLKGLDTRLDRVPNGRSSCRQLTVRNSGPVISREDHRQTIAPDVNAGGVDVDPVVGGDGVGGNIQFEVGDLAVADRDHQFVRRARNRGEVQPPNAHVIGEVLLVDF